MSNNEELIAEARQLIANCASYNFGMHAADKLAHEVAGKLVAALEQADCELAEARVAVMAYGELSTAYELKLAEQAATIGAVKTLADEHWDWKAGTVLAMKLREILTPVVGEPEHGDDWSDWQDGDDGPSCKCGYNGSPEDCAKSRRADEREALRIAVGGVLFNAMNFPERAIPYLLGQDMGPLIDRTANAILAAGYRREPLDSTTGENK